jgi:hypothetical protein
VIRGRFSLAGWNLGTPLTDLQAHALTAGPADRTPAFTALVQACVVAGDVANRIAGNGDLSISATRRGYDMARRHGDPGLIGFARWIWAIRMVEFGARGRASRVAHRQNQRVKVICSPVQRRHVARRGARLYAFVGGTMRGAR